MDRLTRVWSASRTIRRSVALHFRTLAGPRERLTDEARSNAESLAHKSVENRPERGQRSYLSRLDENAKRSADCDPARLRHLPTYAFVYEKQVSVNRLGKEDGCGFTRVQSEVNTRQGIVVADDTDPAGLPQHIDARRRRSSLDDLIPDGLGHNDVGVDGRKEIKNADA